MLRSTLPSALGVVTLLLATGCEPQQETAAAEPAARVASAAAVRVEPSEPGPPPVTDPRPPSAAADVIDDEAWREQLDAAAQGALDAMTAFEARWLERLERAEDDVHAALADARAQWLDLIDGDPDIHPSVADLQAASEGGLAAAVGRLVGAGDELAAGFGGDLDELRADLAITMRGHRDSLLAEYDVLAVTVGAIAPDADALLVSRHLDMLREASIGVQEGRAAVHRRLAERLEQVDELIASEIDVARYELWRHLADTRRAALDDLGVPW
jgi:hypothetical protein